jgi:predicted RNA binding protein YcfA (HicA-like mRNA interferase family)
MRLPRDISGDDLAKALRRLGYGPTRQTGSHIRLTTERNGEHHVTVPRHRSLRIGTLAGVLDEVARHHDITRSQLVEMLFAS